MSHKYGYCCTVVVPANGAVVLVVAFSLVVPMEVSEGALLNLEPGYAREPLDSVGSYCARRRGWRRRQKRG